MKVHIFESEPWIQTAWQATGCQLDTIWIEGLLSKEQASTCADAEIISTDMSLLDESSLSVFKQLKMIAARATGVDNIDLQFCQKTGITVCNVPDYAQTAVAEHVFALLLAIGRQVVDVCRRTSQLDFSWDGIQAFELKGKTLAVIGTGVIGRCVAGIARRFGMQVKAFDAYPDNAWAVQNDVQYGSLDEILQEADIITLHVPGRPETRHLLSAECFDLMKNGVVIINTARGDVVDSRALLGALASGKVAAAGLDVLPGEGHPINETSRRQVLGDSIAVQQTQLANHLLLQHPRVLVTPHCAFFTKEAGSRLVQVTVNNIEAFIRGEPGNIVA